MKRKIFINMAYIAFVSAVFSILLMSVVTYQRYMGNVKEGIQDETEYLAEILNHDDTQDLDRYKDITVSRITLIDTNGDVLYDSTANISSMANHASREEFREAVESGYGEQTRISTTLNQQTYYYAMKLDNNTVIRLSRDTQTIYQQIIELIPVVLLMLGLAFLISLGLSRILTKRIVEPVNELDLEHPNQNDCYEELSPLLVRMHKQNIEIEHQMEALRQQQIEFSTITENMQEGFLVLNRHNVVLSYNTSALQILGVNRETCSHQNILAINRSPQIHEVIEKAQQGQKAESYIDINEKKYLLIANPVFAAGKLDGIILLMMDVTEKTQRENLRREFSANVSHELKTPLTAISGFAELMKEGIAKPEDIKGFSEKIYKEARRLLEMIEGIIKISRLDENKIELEKSTIDLHQMVLSIQEALQLKTQKHQVELKVIGTQTKVEGIEQILYEMLYNIIENGVKYNKPGGQVVVTVATMEDAPVVIVEDNGIGMPQEETERIFERFYRVDKSRSGDQGGTGLGLAIVKHGANLHGITLEVTSEVNQGTKMTLIFPKN